MNYSIETAKDLAHRATQNESMGLQSGACLIAVKVQGSCGEATLPKAKAILEGEELDSSLITGSKLQWFPKEPLRFVNRATQAVARLLNDKGVSFGKGMTLISLQSLPAVLEAIKVIQDDFNGDLTSLICEFDKVIDEHKANNVDVAKHIENYKLDANSFQGRFIFRVTPPMAVSPLFDEDNDEIAMEATETLWEEIARDADSLYQKSFAGKERVTQKAVRPIQRLADKLTNLSFLDDGIDSVVVAFNSALDSLPKSGAVEGGTFHELAHFVLQVSNVNRLRNTARDLTGGIEEREVEEDQAPALKTEFAAAEEVSIASSISSHDDAIWEDNVQFESIASSEQDNAVFALGFSSF